MAATPGHGADGPGVKYRTFAEDAAILRCFQCHSTGKLQLDAGRKIVPAEAGVRCENCHGMGSDHAAKPEAGNIRNPGRMSGEEVNGLCGTCHRMPPAKGVATNWSNPWNARHQPVYLAQSRCFQESKGKLSCVSCHDAHTSSLKDVGAVCGSCHEKPRHRAAVTGGCVSCHMPDVRPNEWLQFANHWIGVYGKGNVLRPEQGQARGVGK